ncbi:MAG: MBL fold metallo-hydrolase, partial [Solirubrobacteraceae bacterium]
MTADLHLIIDPVLTDPFMGGIAGAQPGRVVDVDSIPSPDAVIITHFHAGHLEPDSLALLDRKTQLFIPDDSTVRFVADRLGFTKVATVMPGQQLSMGDLDVTFT